MDPAVDFVSWIRISSWFWGLVCFLNACWAFMQVYCFQQNISIALLQSLVTNENDSIYFIYTQLSCAHRKGGLEAKFTQNSPLLCLFYADAFLVICCCFLSGGLAVLQDAPHVMEPLCDSISISSTPL